MGNTVRLLLSLVHTYCTVKIFNSRTSRPVDLQQFVDWLPESVQLSGGNGNKEGYVLRYLELPSHFAHVIAPLR